MNKNIFIVILTFFIITGVYITAIFSIMGKKQFRDELKNLKVNQISNAMFYKDFLRDSEGLELKITDDGIIKKLADYINRMEPTGEAVKSHKIIKDTKIQLSVIADKQKNIQLTIRKTEKLGDIALISIEIMHKIGYTSGGNFTSPEFLPWLEKLSQNKIYENIWEK